MFTARMIRVMSTSAPLGTPCGHAAVCAVPKAMFTRVMISFTVTSPLPSQSPVQATVVGVGVTVGVGDAVSLGVGVGIWVLVGVLVVV